MSKIKKPYRKKSERFNTMESKNSAPSKMIKPHRIIQLGNSLSKPGFVM